MRPLTDLIRAPMEPDMDLSPRTKTRLAALTDALAHLEVLINMGRATATDLARRERYIARREELLDEGDEC